MDPNPVISVVFSFRNEQDTIPELLTRVRKTLDALRLEYELIFVNDASTDRSLEMLKEEGRKDRRIKIINMSRRFGGSQCVLAGMSHASGDAVIYIDADLQDPPELMAELIARWREGADVVFTTRIDRAGEDAFRMWVTKWAYRILKLASSEMDLPVDSGDFKLLSRTVVQELLRLKEKDPFLRGLVTWVGFKQVCVKYRREKRFAGKSHYPLLGAGPIGAFIAGLTSFSTLPLYASLVIGAIISLGAFAYMIAVVVMFFLGWNIPGWSAIMVTILFLGGVQLSVIGVLGLYLGRIYNEVKNRPNYIIKDTIGFNQG